MFLGSHINALNAVVHVFYMCIGHLVSAVYKCTQCVVVGFNNSVCVPPVVGMCALSIDQLQSSFVDASSAETHLKTTFEMGPLLPNPVNSCSM